MSDFIFGEPSLGENNQKRPLKKDMPWIRDPEEFTYKWYSDEDDECCECGYDDSPCVIFIEGEFFCSEKCALAFEAENQKWEDIMAADLRAADEECAPWIDFPDEVVDDDDFL